MRLIVPLSGTEGSERGLELAQSLAARVGAAVELVNVIDTGLLVDETLDVRQSTADAYLRAVAATIEGETPVSVHLLAGDPVNEISKLALSFVDCVLVLAPRWPGELQPFMPDSVSERLMHNATVPVVLVPERYEQSALVTGNVIMPVTESAPSVQDVITVCATLHGPEIAVRLVAVSTAMNQQNGPFARGNGVGSLDEKHEYQTRSRLLSIGTQLRRRGIKCNWELRVGAPVVEIVRAADTTGAEFIAFVRPGADNPDDEEVVLSALSVSQHAGIPVLIVPSGDRTGQARTGVTGAVTV